MIYAAQLRIFREQNIVDGNLQEASSHRMVI